MIASKNLSQMQDASDGKKIQALGDPTFSGSILAFRGSVVVFTAAAVVIAAVVGISVVVVIVTIIATTCKTISI